MPVLSFVEELPPDQSHNYDWAGVVAALKQHPGQWALLEGVARKPSKTGARYMMRCLKNGMVSGVEPGEFDAATRGDKVYARYLGPVT